ncbi:DUF2145 domain-containing protein [Janthinobacterium sp. SUN118]|uniref:DUF2145 domain-containing protein n=1 Tax=Janthinobacterium sp. SUN118 TaxID=3004100 RepID=UPI0025B1929B|nr:DUF2145 domain-containing protein [Janthinobacterium sp. SUN118]MDN2710519.1 DUF2145 domain-containing protein [Janthinobacterium sp. SUN118]
MRPRRLALLLAVCAAFGGAGAAHAGTSPASARFCDRAQELTAAEQDRLLRFAAVVREELAATEGSVALISRSGLDLARFGIRYSHAALAWRHDDDGGWSARQLYYACDEGRPRIFDQGTAGFAMGTDNPSLGYIALVKLPAETVAPLRRALLDPVRVQQLLAGRYSANAYAYDLKYQNCNQWVVELLASAWGELAAGSDLRARAQDWLRAAPYAPAPVDVGSRWLMLGSVFVPLVHMDDHPREAIGTMRLQVSLPASLEAFARQRLPASERVEICHDGKQVVVHRGWEAIADGCVPGANDRVIALD